MNKKKKDLESFKQEAIAGKYSNLIPKICGKKERNQDRNKMNLKLFITIFVVFVQIKASFCAKCVFIADSQRALCRNVNSINEVGQDLKQNWMKIIVKNSPNTEFIVSGNLKTV